MTVDYATANGSASAPSDYTAATGTLTFAPGQTTKTVTVTVNADVLDEANETFSVNLTGCRRTRRSPTALGLGTITDDDPLPTLSVDDVTVPEGDPGSSPGHSARSLHGDA